MSPAADHRLTIDECRRLLGDRAPASDGDVAALRDRFYELAKVCVFAWAKTEPEDAAEGDCEFEERAAILQFDANLPRKAADRIAAMARTRHRRQ